MWQAILASVLLAAGPQVKVETLSDTFSGELVAVSADSVDVQTPQGKRSFPLQDLMRLDVSANGDAGKSAVTLQLVDGSTLQASQYLVEDGKAKVELAGGSSLSLPVTQVAYVRLQPVTESVKEQWQNVLAKDPGADVLVIRKGEDALDHLEGVIGAVNGERVDFTFAGDKIPVKREKIFGFRYLQKAGRELGRSRCLLIGTSGSKLEVSELSLTKDQTALAIKTPAGIELTFPMNQIAELRGHAEYLSDLKPLSVELTPHLAFEQVPELAQKPPQMKPGFNRHLEGGKLRLGNQQYEKGISLHSKTSIIYHLGGQYRKFLAVAGIDEAVGNLGHAILSIRGDNRQLFSQALAGTDKSPVNIELDISGVQRLEILVDFGKDQEIGDHVDLCNARIIK